MKNLKLDMKKVLSGCTVALFCLVSPDYIFAQCGGETYGIVNQCPNQQPQIQITSPAPTPSVNYRWFSLTPKAPGPGFDTLFFGSLPGYNVTYPSPLTAGGQTVYYQKMVEAIGGPTASPVPNISGASPVTDGTTTPFQITTTSATAYQLNYVTVALFTYFMDATKTYRIKVQVGSNYSQWFYFTSASTIATNSSNVYLIRVPVYQSATQLGVTAPAGTTTITFLTAADGTQSATSSALDGFAWINSSAFSSTYTIGGTTFNYGTSVKTISGQTNKEPALYDWDITTLCSPVTINITQNSTGCCTPASVNTPVISSSTGTNIINTDPVTPAVTLSTPLQAGFYYQWFKDGLALGGAFQGTNVNSISVTTSGKYSVNVAQTATFINTTSCIKNDLLWIQKRILFAQADNTTICLGNSVDLLAKGATGPISWTPGSNMVGSATATPLFTPTATGSFPLSVTAQVPIGNQIINGDFEQGNVAVNPSSYYTYSNAASATTSTPAYGVGYPSRKSLSISPGNYTINNYVFWPGFQAWLPGSDHTTGAGNFLYTDAAAPGSSIAGPAKYLWSQTVTVQPNTNYEFAAWIMNINAEADGGYTPPAGVSGITPNPASNPLPLIMLYINDVPVFAAPPTLLTTVDLWQKVSTTWNSGSTSGNVTLKLSEIFTGSGTAGHDFGLDDISFGAPGNQTDNITITVTDCYYINATASACTGDSVTLTATTNGVFQNWRNVTTGTPTTVNIGHPNSIVTKAKSVTGVSTQFTATASFIFGNEIQNGDFSTNTGFSTSFSTNAPNGNLNPGQYGIGSLPSAWDGTYVNKKDHTTNSATPNYFVANDNYSSSNTVAYSTTVAVTNGTAYGFSGWFANVQKEFLNASPDTLVSAPYPSGGKTTHLNLYINNQFVQRINLPLDTAWHTITAAWTANTTGNVAIELRTVNIPFGSLKNGFAMDDLSFGTLYTTTKNISVSSTNCALPIEFINFYASFDQGHVLLQWETALEKEADYYSIEQSSDGINFVEIGKIKSAGNSSDIVHYAFTDTNPTNGTVYYRVKEVDKNGNTSYTEVRSLNKEDATLNVFPNPSNKEFNLIYNSYFNNPVTIIVRSITGAIVYETTVEANQPTSFGQDLKAGVYILEMKSDKDVRYLKLIKND
jgi:hypothetical protein